MSEDDERQVALFKLHNENVPKLFDAMVKPIMVIGGNMADVMVQMETLMTFVMQLSMHSGASRQHAIDQLQFSLDGAAGRIVSVGKPPGPTPHESDCTCSYCLIEDMQR
jgi:hypothetical protein